LVPGHYMTECDGASYYFMSHEANLASRMNGIYQLWNMCVPADDGLIVVYGVYSFVIKVLEEAGAPTMTSVRGLHGEIPVVVISHCGAIHHKCVGILQKAGASMLQVRMIVRAVVIHTVWYHERNKVHILPVLDGIRIQRDSGAWWTAQYHMHHGPDDIVPQGMWSKVAQGTRQWPEPTISVGWARRGVCATAYIGRQTGGRHIFVPSDSNVLYWRANRIETFEPGTWPGNARHDWSVVVVDNLTSVRSVPGHSWTPVWESSYTGYGRKYHVVCFITTARGVPNTALRVIRKEIHMALASCGFMVRREWALATHVLC
jgi:hypothetical protein